MIKLEQINEFKVNSIILSIRAYEYCLQMKNNNKDSRCHNLVYNKMLFQDDKDLLCSQCKCLPVRYEGVGVKCVNLELFLNADLNY
jgi:hypothetical protein